jgi:UDP:flavonoid glycosyltransferase YjiC (YdhE family)
MGRVRVLLVAHVGETVGHLVRGLAIGSALADMGADVEVAAPRRATWLIRGWSPRFPHHEVYWDWSHNSCRLERPTPSYLERVMRTNRDLARLLSASRPDMIVSLPGVFTAQLARKFAIPQLSVIHGPYLSPIVSLPNASRAELAVMALATSLMVGGCWDSIFSRLQTSLDLPGMTYWDFLAQERICVPQPNIVFERSGNIEQCDFVSASFGSSLPTSSKGLSGSCYVTFGSGNRCDISRVTSVLAKLYPSVIVSTGAMQANASSVVEGARLTATRFIASSELVGRVSTVVSHGGIGTVGTFSASPSCSQVIIPTEVDQATMAVHASRSGLAEACGLQAWASRPRLGRRLPAFADEELVEAVRRAKQTLDRPSAVAGARQIGEIALQSVGTAVATS